MNEVLNAIKNRSVRTYLPTQIKQEDLDLINEPYYGVALGYKSLNKEMIAPKRNLNVVNYIR